MDNYCFDTPKRDYFLKYADITNKSCIIGRGSYGIVVKAGYKGRKVAVKIISKFDSFKYSSISRERNTLNLSHKNIIKILKIVETKDSGAIIMERFDHGKNLQIILDNCIKIDLLQRLKILRDIANGLSFCHNNHIIHRDLKPDNLMLVLNFERNDFSCKIFDFGCSYKFNDSALAEDEEMLSDCNIDDMSTSIVGTIRYTAPELLQGCAPTPSIDVYSFGILMWQLKENKIPYEQIKSNEVIIWQVVKNNLRPDSEREFKNNNSIKFPNSNLLSLDINKSFVKSLTPVKLQTISNSRKSSKSDFKHDKFISKCVSRGSKNISRKSLFNSKLLGSLGDENDDYEVPDVSIDIFTDFLKDHRLYLRKKGDLRKIETEYEEMYRTCWDENPTLRPNVDKICSRIEEFINYIN